MDPLDEEAIALRGLLAGEYCAHDLLEKWEDLARFETKLFPDEPVPWISLAGFLLHAKEDLVEALATVDVAIKKAEQKGEWVRHAYCTRARIARAMEDFGLLEATIKHLIDYQPTPGSIDIHLEHDFVATMPAGKIDEEILGKYNALKSVKTGPFEWPGPGPD